MRDVGQIWVYLSASPLLHLTLTLVMLSIVAIVSILALTGTRYQTYFDGAQFVHFLLGPATVALAIPLYRQFDKVRRSAVAVLASIIAGSATAAASAVGIAWLLGGSKVSLVSLAPKSVTAPVAMGIAEQLGGLPSLTAVLVISTGILGAILGPYVLNVLGIRNMAARGLAMGTAGHGIGTARAMQVNEVAGAFSGLAMGLNALATALLLPLVWRLFT
jgi:predicted murein hydrolase (TIGR00659 family)